MATTFTSRSFANFIFIYSPFPLLISIARNTAKKVNTTYLYVHQFQHIDRRNALTPASRDHVIRPPVTFWSVAKIASPHHRRAVSMGPNAFVLCRIWKKRNAFCAIRAKKRRMTHWKTIASDRLFTKSNRAHAITRGGNRKTAKRM